MIIAPTQTNTNTNSNNQSASDDINNVDVAQPSAPVVVGNEDDHSVGPVGGDNTQVDHVSGPVDASHDDNSTHHQSGIDVDLF